VKRLFGWLAGAVGGAAVYRALRRRPAAASLEESPADELRAKLASAREADGEHLARSAETGETPAVDETEPLDPDARRRAVHEQGRAAIDELRGE
jgi:hypothetical protein